MKPATNRRESLGENGRVGRPPTDRVGVTQGFPNTSIAIDRSITKIVWVDRMKDERAREGDREKEGERERGHIAKKKNFCGTLLGLCRRNCFVVRRCG